MESLERKIDRLEKTILRQLKNPMSPPTPMVRFSLPVAEDADRKLWESSESLEDRDHESIPMSLLKIPVHKRAHEDLWGSNESLTGDTDM